MRVLEAHGQRAALEHGLQGLGLIQRVAARDGDLPAGDLGLDGRGGLHLAVQDDDDLAVGGSQVARCPSERLGAGRVERDVHRVVGREVRCLPHRHVRDLVARDERGVRARLDGHVAHLARGKRVAEVIGDGDIAGVIAALNIGLRRLVGEGVKPREGERARLADGLERLLRVGHAGNLHEDLVVALQLHDRLRGAQRIHAALDDGAGFLHVVGRNRLAGIRLRGEHHREAALHVKTLVDLLAGRGEQRHRHHHEHGGDNQQPQVAAVGPAGGLLLGVAFDIAL